jgi:hypothetical protein
VEVQAQAVINRLVQKIAELEYQLAVSQTLNEQYQQAEQEGANDGVGDTP